MSTKTEAKVVFEAYVARTTESDVLSEHVGRFRSLGAAEAAVQRLAADWHGATVYEVAISYDRDNLGLIEVGDEVSTRHYVPDGEGGFVLDDLVTP